MQSPHPLVAGVALALYGLDMSDVMPVTNHRQPAYYFDAERFPDHHPGCYLMKGEGGRVLYVGKAINLRSRLSSYFRHSRTPHRKAEMISRIRDIEVILVRNEREALILESHLIRHLDPPYNSRFTRDDDSYYYIALTDGPFPRLVTYRKRHTHYALQTGNCEVAALFGPYTGWNIRNRILGVVRTLYPLRSCHSLPDVPCFRAESKTCLAPCIPGFDETVYRLVVAKAARFLRRPPLWRIETWKREMKAAAEELDFAEAGMLRDRVLAVEHARYPQAVERSDHQDIDVLYFADDQVVTLEVRAGDVLALNGPERVVLTPNHVSAFLESRYAANTLHRIVVNACIDWDTMRDRFPIYIPQSATTPLGQLQEIARMNHDYRTRSAEPRSKLRGIRKATAPNEVDPHAAV